MMVKSPSATSSRPIRSSLRSRDKLQRVVDERLDPVDLRRLEEPDALVDLTRFFDLEVLARRRLEVDEALLLVTRETPCGRL
jgi:hypothetical protein